MMKLGKLYLLVVCLLSGSLVKAQKARLLYASSELQDSLRKQAIKDISYAYAWSTIKIRYQNGSVKRVPKVSIWGYVDSKGNVYRQYKKDFFKLVSQGALIKYTNLCLYCLGNRFPRPIDIAWYSKTLDSRIYTDSIKARFSHE